jgi:hypothetical protein
MPGNVVTYVDGVPHGVDALEDEADGNAGEDTEGGSGEALAS